VANDQQVMMTLAALAYTDQTTMKDPQTGANETQAQQSQRILGDLNNNASCGLKQTATTQDWSAIRVGLSADRANMAFIAENTALPSTYAVAIRGSDFALFIDALENFRVQEVEPFASGGHIAAGADEAFRNVSQAQYLSSDGQGADLLATLQALISSPPAGTTTTVYVTGHSLGGAIATTVSLYLQTQLRGAPVVFQVYTFAAPTVGDQDFATAFDAAFPGTAGQSHSSWRVFNEYDVVPNAWQTLSAVKNNYYPNPGPAATMTAKLMIDGIGTLAGFNKYVHPNAAGSANAVAINVGYKLFDSGHLGTDQHGFWGYLANNTPAFLSQLYFQHGCNTYLSLLGATNVNLQT
jgi:hypothetical protein